MDLAASERALSGSGTRAGSERDEIAHQARLLREQAGADPSGFGKALERLCRVAFVEGFSRALEHSSRQAREGRLRRLCTLWATAKPRVLSTSVEVSMSPAAFREFDRLLEMTNLPRGSHAQDPSDTDRSGQAG